jgi:hypothetical protein
MPDLEQELEHLAEANTHIANGERLLARLEQLIDRMSKQGGDTTKAKDSLQAMRDVLVTFHRHRAAIAQTIDDIRSGKFNSRR